MVALEPSASPAIWRATGNDGGGALFRLCDNAVYHGVCNGAVPAESLERLCRACRFTTKIPSLDGTRNVDYWGRLERAKRRLLFGLADLGLPLDSVAERPADGLAFAFGADVAPGNRFVTGHHAGLISINIAEADDVERERVRTAMGEPARTLLGHFRHESGHYYMDRFARDSALRAVISDAFGDVDRDYEASLRHYYFAGPIANWVGSYISAYATAHPQEDFAETWAHYLHLRDATQSALESDLKIDAPPDAMSFTPNTAFDRIMQRWLHIAEFANEMARSVGTADVYPFVLTEPVIAKLRAIHRLVAH